MDRSPKTSLAESCIRDAVVVAVLSTLLTACPAPVTPAIGRVFHVAPAGRDDAPGTRDQPWATPEHAARVLGPGDRVVIHGGEYALASPVRPRRSGTPHAWIEYAAAPGQEVILDASAIELPPSSGSPPFPHDQGAVQIEGVAYIRMRGLTVRNSHQAGFTIRDSHHVALLHNTTDSTFASGIAAWDTDHDDRGTEHIQIIGNTVTRANTEAMLPAGMARPPEPPHEAISVGGALHFEVAHNHVHHCDKEGIDIKETSKHGRVHHNHVHHVARQGLYVDSWFGDLLDVELDHNVVHHCEGAGVVLSVENGRSVQDVRIHHNLVYQNLGTGVFFSRWGDGPRRDVELSNNTIVRNGHGPPKPGEPYYWLTGGIYLYSDNLRALTIRDNIISNNAAFQIGLSEHYLGDGVDLATALASREILIEHNLVHPRPDPAGPLRVGWPPDDYAWVTPVAGKDAIVEAPDFVDPRRGDLRLRPGSAAAQPPVGALPFDGRSDPAARWWIRDSDEAARGPSTERP